MDIMNLVHTMVTNKVREEVVDRGQFTLGELYQVLKTIKNKSLNVIFDNPSLHPYPNHIGSYRGYYDHVAIFTDDQEQCTVGELENMIYDAIGETFTGYKGGKYLMDEDTPVWAENAHSECTGIHVVGTDQSSDCVVLLTKLEEEL